MDETRVITGIEKDLKTVLRRSLYGSILVVGIALTVISFDLLVVSDAEGISSIAMPRIGAGYGGLSWKKVRPIIEKVFNDWSGTLYVYEDFVPGQ